MAKFVHLHTHTEYSLLDGLSKIKKLAAKVKELSMDSIAITDHGSMFGAIEFYKTCMAEGVKPIIGLEAYVAPRSHKSKEGKVDTEPYHLTLLAKNYQGYLNLMKLVSISHLEGFYYKPRIDKELLKEYHEGIIGLSGCPAGELIRSLDGENVKKAREVIETYLDIFGEGNYLLEVQNHHYKDLLKKASNIDSRIQQDLNHMGNLQDLTWDVLKDLSKKLGIPMVATNDLHYVNEDDAVAQDALVCIQTGKFLSDINRLRMVDTPNLFLRSPENMADAFKEIPDAVENTVMVAQQCELEIPLGKPMFPIFEIPQGKTADDYLRELTFERAAKRMEMTQERVDRLNYELSVIEQKKYPTYFLIVSDFVNWAKEQGILTTTRGSAAGSLVLYALGVTDVDPIFYKLPFERFLNPFRPSLPDIDSDMADDRRDDVIRYVMSRYGEDKVAHICTFGTMMGRAAIRDVGRVMAVPYAEVDKVAKMVPPPHQGFHKPLAEAIQEVPELNEAYHNNPQYKQMLDLAVKIEGTVRHASVHAAGIVIAPEPITNFTPVQREANGDKVVTQYDMFACEDVGLVKMDFLGIRNLSILGKSVEYVKANRGIDIDIKNIPLDDKKAFELLARGETMGLFQLESDGMTKNLMELKPTTIFDISAMVALYRPGPLSIIPEYIARKHNPSKISYFDPRMKEYLERSLGLLVYQDDVLLTAINIAGYNWEEADKFRKAMGKKIPAEMAKQKDHFIEGAITNGLTEERAHELFKLIEPFAAYGFNKAHAASYGLVAYQTAYMKSNFPEEFMAAVMTAEYGNTEKIAHAIDECKRMDILVFPPDVNKSFIGFTLEEVKSLSKDELDRQITDVSIKKGKQGIRFGLSAIKNVGISAIESILKAREDRPFKDLLDLCLRVDTRLVNRKTLESLVKAGALDSFGKRSAQLEVLEQCLEEAHKVNKATANGQGSLFDGFGENEEAIVIDHNFKLPDVEEFTLEQLLTFEKDLLGFYLHEPTYMAKVRTISHFTTNKISQISEIEDFEKKVKLGGVIMDVRKVITKKSGAEMAFIKLFDGTGEVSCVIFPKIYDQFKDSLIKEEVVLMTGKVEIREEDVSYLVDNIEIFDPEVSVRVDTTFVEIEIPDGIDKDVLKKVNDELRKFPGPAPISILIPQGDTFKKLSLKFTVDPNFKMVESVEKILGPNTIRLI